jgi:hypothetical protein
MSWFDNVKTIALGDGHVVSLDEDELPQETVSGFFEGLAAEGFEKITLEPEVKESVRPAVLFTEE